MSKKTLQVGDLVRNRATKEVGEVVRFYSNLIPAKHAKAQIACIVSLPEREVLWREGEIDFSAPAP